MKDLRELPFTQKDSKSLSEWLLRAHAAPCRRQIRGPSRSELFEKDENDGQASPGSRRAASLESLRMSADGQGFAAVHVVDWRGPQHGIGMDI